MAGGLLTFLIGCLVIIVVLAVVKIVMRKIEIDADVKQIVWLIIGLVALVVLIYLAVGAFGGGSGIHLPG
jgi:uncharacterized membrane protein